MRPESFISYAGGKCSVIYQRATPLTTHTLSLQEAITFAEKQNIQTALIWNGDQGQFNRIEAMIDDQIYQKDKEAAGRYR